MTARRRDVLCLQKGAQRFRRYERRLIDRTRAGDGSRLQIHHAGEAALRIDRRRAGEAELWRRVETLGVAMRRHARDRAAAGLGQRIGDADKREVITRAAVAREPHGQKVLRAVNAQQRDIVGLVGGDAFGMAKTRNCDGLAAVGDLQT